MNERALRFELSARGRKNPPRILCRHSQPCDVSGELRRQSTHPVGSDYEIRSGEGCFQHEAQDRSVGDRPPGLDQVEGERLRVVPVVVHDPPARVVASLAVSIWIWLRKDA